MRLSRSPKYTCSTILNPYMALCRSSTPMLGMLLANSVTCQLQQTSPPLLADRLRSSNPPENYLLNVDIAIGEQNICFGNRR